MYLSNKQLREPPLLVPKGHPLGPVKINSAFPFAKNIFIAFIAKNPNKAVLLKTPGLYTFTASASGTTFGIPTPVYYFDAQNLWNIAKAHTSGSLLWITSAINLYQSTAPLFHFGQAWETHNNIVVCATDDNKIYVSCRKANADVYIVQKSLTPPTRQVAACVTVGPAGVRLFVDGVLADSNASTVWLAGLEYTGTNGYIWHGYLNQGGSVYSSVGAPLAVMFDTQLPDVVAASLSRDPYQLLIPA